MPTLPALPSIFKRSDKSTASDKSAAKSPSTSPPASPIDSTPPKITQEKSYEPPKFSIENIDKLSNEHPELNYFKIVKIVGKGGFAKVYQAIRKNDNRIFALKVMRKDLIKKMRQVRKIFHQSGYTRDE